MMNLQAPGAVVMVRPHHFNANPQTADDNAFQSPSPAGSALGARAEHDAAVAQLRTAGIVVHVYDDHTEDTPDSVFPNNWFSTHAGGHVAIYPMYASNRRKERRWDVIEDLKAAYRVQDVIDYSGLEADNLALEGTGAMVLDHLAHVAYVARSKRADPVLLERFCTHFGYEPMVFDASDPKGQPMYHTNVLMCIGTEFALIGANLINATTRRAEVLARLSESGRDIVDLTPAQIARFCGNAIELSGSNGRVLALSSTALAALQPAQIKVLERHATLLPIDIPTLESAGGSVRCMIAGLHLSARPDQKDPSH